MSGTGIEGYRVYLAHRDGDADLLHRRLANRDEFFRSLETDPVRSARPIDRQVFMRNLRRRRPEPGLDRELLFLLATAKLNQAERTGSVSNDRKNSSRLASRRCSRSASPSRCAR